MAPQDIDSYLATVDEPRRTTSEELRRSILAVIPDAEQCISYGMPAFKVRGKTVAGFRQVEKADNRSVAQPDAMGIDPVFKLVTAAAQQCRIDGATSAAVTAVKKTPFTPLPQELSLTDIVHDKLPGMHTGHSDGKRTGLRPSAARRRTALRLGMPL
jgi:uncharacterized protein YdhG (YjbR/CyaY superfamily)